MLKVDRFGPVFKQIHDALEKNANNLLRADDLTMAQVHLLFLLEESPDGCYSLKELERRLRVAQSTMVGVVKRSAQKGFVECYGDPHDKRVKHVRITPEGRRICAAAQKHMGRIGGAVSERDQPGGTGAFSGVALQSFAEPLVTFPSVFGECFLAK